MTVPRNIFTCADYPNPAIIADLHPQTVCAALLCRACEDFPVCVAVIYLTLEQVAKDTEEKILCRSLFSKRSHIGNLRQIRKQGKGRSPKRKGNRRCPFLFAPAAGRGTFPPSADGESPAEIQRKTSRPPGANTLTQFGLGQSVQGNDSFPIDTVGIPRYTYN